MADTPDPTDLADRIDALAESGHWVSIGTIGSHKKILLDRRQLDELRAAAAELRRLAALETAARAFVDDDGQDEGYPAPIDRKFDALIAALEAPR